MSTYPRFTRVIFLSLTTLCIVAILRTQITLEAIGRPWLTPSRPTNPRRLHHLLPINRDSVGSRFCKTLLSSFVHGYSPIILNWEAEGDANYMQRKKVSAVYEFIMQNLTDTNDDDLIFMMDALDVWLQHSPEILIRRYEELEEDVIIGVDKACWPNEWDGPVCQGVPESPLPVGTFGDDPSQSGEYGSYRTRPRWANSGTIIGTVASMRPLYKDLTDQFAHSSPMTDQGIFNDFLFQGRVAVDYWFRLFWTNAFDLDSGVIMNTRYPLDGITDPTIPYHLLPSLVYHRMTGEVPVTVHFNDLHKSLMEQWWGLLWWTKQEPRFRDIVLERIVGRTVTFGHNGSTATYDDLCPVAL